MEASFQVAFFRRARTLIPAAAIDGDCKDAPAVSIVAVIERDALLPKTLGLTFAKVKAILSGLQAAIVASQVAAHGARSRTCAACGSARGVRGQRPLTCRTAFGTVRVEAARLRRCGFGSHPVARDRASFSPLAELLPERTMPELLYLETRWGSHVSYGLAARMLGDVLPIETLVPPERVRRHLHAAAAREETALRGKPDTAWSGCQPDLDEMSSSDGPAYVGVHSGLVRDRAGSWFEVIAGKCVSGLRRDAPATEPLRPARCFAFIQAHNNRPRRRLLDVLASQGWRAISGVCGRSIPSWQQAGRPIGVADSGRCIKASAYAPNRCLDGAAPGGKAEHGKPGVAGRRARVLVHAEPGDRACGGVHRSRARPRGSTT